jgi:ubiquitin-activating enzyme E1 C
MDTAVDHRGDHHGRWADIDGLLLRPGSLVGAGFEPGEDVKSVLHDVVHVLVVGAGGLGCELLKDLALSGFKNIDVIDMDTIDVSNLNRQFLFTSSDVGQSKASCAARAVERRVAGVRVTPHFCRLEEKPDEWYRQFHVIVLGLDSIEARSYVNKVACGFLKFHPDGSAIQTTIKPMIDGGTEGFKGHARVLIPGVTPCFECTAWLFPPQTTFPLCTLAETPRCAAHCVEYARLIQWRSEYAPGASAGASGPPPPAPLFDGDDPEHVQWVFQRASERAARFDIPGVTLSFTQGVVKNIIPAIPSTNAVVAAACSVETLKLATVCSPGLANYVMYNGAREVYTHTVAYEKDPECVACSPGVSLEIPRDCTLGGFVKRLVEKFPDRVEAPSVSFAGGHLYLRGVLESVYAPNLSRTLRALCGLEDDEDTTMVFVNDKKMKRAARVRVVFREKGGSEG